MGNSTMYSNRTTLCEENNIIETPIPETPNEEDIRIEEPERVLYLDFNDSLELIAPIPAFA